MGSTTSGLLLAAVALVTGVIGGYFVGHHASEPDLNIPVSTRSDSNDEDCKMVLVVRKDIPMTKGKIAAQCGHAAVACYEKSAIRDPATLERWKSHGQAKIALQCPDLAELQRLQVRARRLGLVAETIVDAGRTQIDPGTTTVLGVGPGPVSVVNEITGHLKLL